MDHRDRSLIIRLIGALLLLAGVSVLALGPFEMICFYWFSEGGRFHYEGFGFGSFMFGNIAAQIVGYYVIGLAAVGLGYGHLTVRRWVRPLALAAVWFWVVAGIPLLLIVFFVLLASKELPLAAVVVAAGLLVLSYALLPVLLIRFYRSRNTVRTFERRDPAPSWVERVPVPLLVLAALGLFGLIVLHLAILFNGAFPLFGRFVYDMEGIVLLDAAILCLALLVWGVLKRQVWAWWGGLIYAFVMTGSTLLTLALTSYAELLVGMAFPTRELEFLDGLPFEGTHFAALAAVPLLATLTLLVRSKRYFGSQPEVTGT